MKKFIYRDHNIEKIVFECITSDILEADKLYKKETGNNIMKQPHVGCEIQKIETKE